MALATEGGATHGDTTTTGRGLTALEQVRAAWITVVPALVVFAGVSVRLRQYAFRRSLWNDEAALAWNLVNKGYLELLEPLDKHQGAPLGFLWAAKTAVVVFGDNEYGFRLVPLLGGIASVFMFLRVARRLLSPAVVPLALVLFAFADSLVYFSTETKQYAVDVAAVLVIVDVTIRLLDRPMTLQRGLTWGACCSAGLWFSHAAVFAAAAATATIALRVLARRDREQWVPAAAAMGVVATSLVLLYVVSLRRLSADPDLLAFWAFGMPPAGAGIAERIGWIPRGVANLVPDPIAVRLPAVLLGLVVVGTAGLALRRRWHLAVVAGTFGVGGIATLLRRYPMAWRLALFIVPLAFLVAAAAPDLPLAISSARVRSALRGLLVVPLVMLATGPVLDAAHAVRHPYTVSEMRPIIEQIAAQRHRDDLLLTHWTAGLLAEHYALRLGLQRDGHVAFDTNVACPPGSGAAALPAGQRVWIVFAYPVGYEPAADNADAARAQFDAVGERLQHLSEPGVEADLYEVGTARAPTPSPPFNACFRVHVNSPVPSSG